MVPPVQQHPQGMPRIPLRGSILRYLESVPVRERSAAQRRTTSHADGCATIEGSPDDCRRFPSDRASAASRPGMERASPLAKSPETIGLVSAEIGDWLEVAFTHGSETAADAVGPLEFANGMSTVEETDRVK